MLTKNSLKRKMGICVWWKNFRASYTMEMDMNKKRKKMETVKITMILKITWSRIMWTQKLFYWAWLKNKVTNEADLTTFIDFSTRETQHDGKNVLILMKIPENSHQFPFNVLMEKRWKIFIKNFSHHVVSPLIFYEFCDLTSSENYF